MSDPLRPTAPFPPDVLPGERAEYRIMRKGSRYNILGPHGREFVKYQSASDAGPRWEELTHTPWPYPSAAYARGQRLWELGLIDRRYVGAQEIVLRGAESVPDSEEDAGEVPAATWWSNLVIAVPLAVTALPAPRQDITAHERVMESLRRDPGLLFTPRVRQALSDEVLYHRPHAAWAQHLLNLLRRYERQQQRQRPAPEDPANVTAKHVAWQEQRFSESAIASLSC